MPPKRASRISAPGAERIKLTGIVAANDCYDRVRLMILDESRNGYPNNSASQLRKYSSRGARKVPYVLSEEYPLPASAEGVRGICWFVLPKAHKKHWLTTASELRGRWVRIEALVRHYNFEADGKQHAGLSLDLAMLEELPLDTPANTE